jgi:chorismate mutase
VSVRGVRGATTVRENDAAQILAATRALLQEMLARNRMAPQDIAVVFFTVTDDLDAAFPARAARELGWTNVPLMDAREVPVPGSLPRCIRVLALWNTDLPQDRVAHVYQGDAIQLRPDLAKKEGENHQGTKTQRN